MSGDRTNAPLLCYLVGRAAGGSDLASARRRGSPIDVLTHPALDAPPPHGAPPGVAGAASDAARLVRRLARKGDPPTEEELLRCHTADHVGRDPGGRGAHVARRRHARRARRRRRLRSSPPARRSRPLAAGPSRSCGRPATTRSRGARDGLLHLQQRRRRGPGGAGETASGASRSSTGTCTTATGRRRSSAATTPSSSSRCTSGRSIPAPADPATRRRRR